MNKYALKLKQFIEEHKVNCQQQGYEQDVSNSLDCTDVLGVGLNGIIKTIIMLSDKGRVLTLILNGDYKIDHKLLKEEYRCKDLLLASPEQILQISGYPLGGVPPLGFKAEFIVDALLIEEKNKEFYAGGGSTQALIKITPAEILKQNAGKVLKFSKLI